MTRQQNGSRSEDNRNKPTHHPTAAAKRQRAIFLISIVAVSIVLTFLVQLPHLLDRYQVEKDVQNFYWMARYQDPALFPVDHLWGDDAVVELTLLGHHVALIPRSLGYGLLFWVGSFVIDHVWMAKLLGFPLMAISAGYLFKLGDSIGDEFTGAALSLLSVFIILASPRSTAITTGVQRAFAIPLLIVFTYYLHQKRYWFAAAMIFVSLLFYYPNFLIAGLTYVLAMVEVKRPLRIRVDLSQSKLIPLVLVAVLSLGVVAGTVATEPDRVVPKEVPVSQDARFQPGGVRPLFTGFPLMGRAGVFGDGGVVLNFFTLAVVTCVMFAKLGRASLRRTPPVFGRLLLAGVMLYGASLVVFYRLSSSALYLPSRHTRSTLIWTAMGFVGLNMLEFLDELIPWLRRNYRLVIFFIVSLAVALAASFAVLPIQLGDHAGLIGQALILGGALVSLSIGMCLRIVRSLLQRNVGAKSARPYWLILVLILTVTAPIARIYVNTLAAQTINPSPAERDVYTFLAKLPKDAMIAGDPHVMVGVPLFSERSVLFRELFPRADAPIVDFFDAYYAESPERMLAFCQRQEVDYLVIDHSDFAPDYVAEGEFFYLPYNDAIVDLVAGRSDFLAPKLDPVFSSGPLAVIPCTAETLQGDA